jgi:hypothetical protein
MNSQSETLRAGIAIDEWKLPIFKRYLSGAEFEYTQTGGLAPGTLMLYVETLDLNRLARVVKAANAEAARSKLQ